jgi:hypothetical protein
MPARAPPRQAMTKKVPFTQAGLRRAIAAARKSGLRVIGIRPDGTLVLEERNNPQIVEKFVEEEREIVL